MCRSCTSRPSSRSTSHGGSPGTSPSAKSSMAHVQEIARNASSSALAQFTPMSGGFAAIQPVGLRDDAAAVSRIAGEPPGAAERQPVLVPVQLPDHLVVARRRIEVRHVGPEAARRAAARHRDPGASRSRRSRAVEAQPLVSEQVVLAVRRCDRRACARHARPPGYAASTRARSGPRREGCRSDRDRPLPDVSGDEPGAPSSNRPAARSALDVAHLARAPSAAASDSRRHAGAPQLHRNAIGGALRDACACAMPLRRA